MFSRLRSLETILNHDHYEELIPELDGIIAENGGADGLEELISSIRESDFPAARVAIHALMHTHKPPVRKGESDLAGLKTALQLLETRVSVLNHRKFDLLRRINAFRLRHNQEVGNIMARILFLRKEMLFMDMKNDASLRDQFREADAEYDTYHQEAGRVMNAAVADLTEQQQKELSSLYRKISKHCHPDMVSEEMRHDAALFFGRLNRAYVAADLDEMRRLFALLEQEGLGFSHRDEAVTENKRIMLRIRRLEDDSNDLRREIAQVEDSAVWQLILSTDDLVIYFTRLRDKLRHELEKLEQEYERRKGAEKE